MRKLFIVSAFILLFTVGCVPKGAVSEDHIFIIATNDMHANIYSMPQLKSLVDEYAEQGEVLLVDAGDRVSGNAFVDDDVRPGVPMIELMNTIGYDVVTLGNHEFDKGKEALKDMIAEAEFKTVCANVECNDKSINFEDYTTIELCGVKFGFVGVVDTDEMGHPLGDDAVYADFTFSNDIDTACEVCRSVAAECDFVVLLSHMGDKVDEKFIQLKPACHWVAGGHTHERRNCNIDGVRLTQGSKDVRGVIVADFVVSEGEILSVEYSYVAVDEYAADATVADMVAQIKSRNPELSSVEGYAADHFTRDGVANMTIESLRTYPYSDGFVPEVVFYHYGGIRLSAILKGGITRGDIFNNDPFNSHVMTGEMTGAQMRDFIMRKYNSVGEGGRADKESHSPYFRSNIAYNIILDQSGDAADILFELEDDRNYRVALCDYIAKKYIDQSVVDRQFRSADVSVRDAMLRYVRSFEGVSIEPDNTIHQREIKPNK